jgi:hypothetical protein
LENKSSPKHLENIYKTRGVSHYMALPFTLKNIYLKAKEEL